VKPASARRALWLALFASANSCLFVEPLDPVNDDAGAAGESNGGSKGPPATGGSNSAGNASSMGGSSPSAGRSGSSSVGGNAGRGGSSATHGGSGGTGGSGMGGSAGHGGSGGSSGGSGGSTTTPPDGYVTSGAWKGFAWVAGMGATFDNDVSSVKAGAPLCTSGTVAPDPSFANYATLGVNLDQDTSGDPMGVTPSQVGVIVDATNSGGSTLRLQLVSEDASTVWCIPVDQDGSFFYPWNAFVSNCWAAGGKAYAGEPIASIGLAVGGTTSSEIPFDFCLNSLKEATVGTARRDLSTCAPSCDDGLIDDAEGRIGLIYSQQGRAGAWYTYDDMSGGEQTLVLHATPGAGSKHALHVWGDSYTDWGTGLGVSLNQPVGAPLKHAYDASGYTGFRFAYSSKSLMHVVVHTLATTSTMDAYASGGTCVGDAMTCGGFRTGKNGPELAASSAWTTVDVPFSTLVQPTWSLIPTTAFDPSELVSIAFESPGMQRFDLSIDDLTFY
jgi:hypothetical protein